MYFTNWHHIMSNVLPTVEITKKYFTNRREKIMKTLGKTENWILYGVTHPSANRWRWTQVNTFSSFSKNIFHWPTSFTKFLIKTLCQKNSACQTWALKSMNITNKKIFENTSPPKTKLCNWVKKENCSMRGACLTENSLYYSK